MDANDPRAERFKRAVFAGDASELRAAFAEHPELSEVIDRPWFHFGAPAVVEAAGRRDRELLDALLDLDADVEARSEWEAGPYSALHRLVDGATPESLEIAEHLVGRGATVDLHAAAGMGRADEIERALEDAPERVNEPGPDGAAPLHLARDVEIAGLLLDYGADVDQRCVDHRSTPAMWAMGGREPVARLLIEHGARPDLFLAAAFDDVPLAAAILDEEPEAIDAFVYFGHSCDHLGHGDKYTWTLNGADTPLEVARVRDNRAVYDFLLERSGTRARLIQASRRGDADEVGRLIDENPDLPAALSERDACLVLYGSAQGARALLARGVDPNVRGDRADATALHHAAWRGDPELVEVLLSGGADPGALDGTYEATPLGWAMHSHEPDPRVVALLGGEPEAGGADGTG